MTMSYVDVAILIGVLQDLTSINTHLPTTAIVHLVTEEGMHLGSWNLHIVGKRLTDVLTQLTHEAQRLSRHLSKQAPKEKPP